MLPDLFWISCVILNKNFKRPNKFQESKERKLKLSPSTIANNKRYTVQITSKKVLRDAQLFTKSMIAKGYDAYIQKSIINDNNN